MDDFKNYSELELLFIKEQLWLHSEELTELFERDIQRKNLIRDENLLNTFTDGSNYRVFERSGRVYLTLAFPIYSRFIEINYHKKIKQETNNIAEKKFGTKKKKKDTQWYSRNMYGSQNLLIGRLMWGLSDIERERLKNILEREK